MLRAIVIAATLFATTAQAEEYCEATGGTAPIPTAVIGMEYIDIAKIMDDHGWKPIPQEQHPRRGYSANAKWFGENGYTEVKDCSGTGRGFCAFMWDDEIGNDIRVITELNYPLSDDNIRHDLVVGFRLICRDTNGELTYDF